MNLFNDFSNFSLMNDDVEFSRYYKLYIAEDGTEYIQDISERTFEKQCLNAYEIITRFEYGSRNYIIAKDSNETVYLNEYRLLSNDRIEMLPVESELMEKVIQEYMK